VRARPRVRIDDDLRQSALGRGAETVHPPQARPAGRVSSNSRFSARGVEPGSDLWGTVRARRERSIDEENPYPP
jgi:hypothetical protein